MRPIKFRGWDANRKKMLQVCELFLEWSSPTAKWWSGWRENHTQECVKIGLLPGEEIVLMQFTGLHDKNRKEIYEEDVVRLKYYETHLKENPKGLWGRSGLRGDDPIMVPGETDEIERIEQVKIPDFYIEIDRLREKFGEDPCQCIEVIGNIYENPDLVKGTK